MEVRTRETYTYYLTRHILPGCGSMRINEIEPADVREWVSDLKAAGASPSVIRQCHTILSAVFTTAFNDQITRLHPCRGVTTPPVPKKLQTIITPDQFDQLYTALPSDTARLIAEVLIESGLRWAELIELHPANLNPRMRLLTVSRVAVELVAKFHATGGRFLIKDYPKDREHRRIKLAAHIAKQLQTHIAEHGLTPNDLLFTPTLLAPPADPSRLQLVAEPVDLGLTAPNAAGRQYRHGTLTGYNPGSCKCEHCRGAYATYRAQRRAAGKDPHPAPRTTRSRTLTTDGHIPRSWFREHIWKPALDTAGIGIHVRTHDLRHAHASWLLALGSWLLALGSWLLALGSWLLALGRRSRPPNRQRTAWARQHRHDREVPPHPRRNRRHRPHRIGRDPDQAPHLIRACSRSLRDCHSPAENNCS